MFDLRDLKLLTARAHHKHFGRAAEECGISQPAFSMRIRNLEDRFGSAIVRRGKRFQGLTPEGVALVERARPILSGIRSLEEEFQAATGEISGTLTLAVVPTAVAFAARLSGHLHKQYPGIVVRIETASSYQIQLWLDEGAVDAGVTYADDISGDVLEVQPLYEESYLLVCPKSLAPRTEGSIKWVEAADLPLALLEPAMLNRRILNETFESIGSRPTVISESNSLTSALVLARDGHAATVIPASLIDTLGPPPETCVLALEEPQVRKSIGLITSTRSAPLPSLTALKQMAQQSYDQI